MNPPWSDRWFSREADAIFLATPATDYDDLRDRIASLEREVSTKTLQELEQREYSRRIAELRLFVARKKHRPLVECEELHAERVHLGFQTPYHEAIECSTQARYCLAMGDSERARHYASQQLSKGGLPAELEAALQETLAKAGPSRA
jgi:hypothetical protein